MVVCITPVVLVIGIFHCLFHSFIHVIQSSIGLTYVYSILSKSILVRNLILFVIFSRPTMNNCGYDLVVLKPEDFEQVAVFLDNHYYCFDSRNPLVRIIIFRFDMILLPCFSCLNFVHITTLLLCFRGVARIFRRGGGQQKPRWGQATSDSRRKVRARHSVQCWVKLIVDKGDSSARARVKNSLVKKLDWFKLHPTLI
jgi:hypothetical protein